MKYKTALLITALAFSGLALLAQRPQAVDSSARYHRLIAIVHLVGSGTTNDPIRPQYVPAPAAPSALTAAAARSGIIAWRFELTDDKTMAIVHLVAVDRHAFDPIFADTRPEVHVFEVGAVAATAISGGIQQYRKDFDLDNFQVVAQ